MTGIINAADKSISGDAVFNQAERAIFACQGFAEDFMLLMSQGPSNDFECEVSQTDNPVTEKNEEVKDDFIFTEQEPVFVFTAQIAPLNNEKKDAQIEIFQPEQQANELKEPLKIQIIQDDKKIEKAVSVTLAAADGEKCEERKQAASNNNEPSFRPEPDKNANEAKKDQNLKEIQKETIRDFTQKAPAGEPEQHKKEKIENRKEVLEPAFFEAPKDKAEKEQILNSPKNPLNSCEYYAGKKEKNIFENKNKNAESGRSLPEVNLGFIKREGAANIEDVKESRPSAPIVLKNFENGNISRFEIKDEDLGEMSVSMKLSRENLSIKIKTDKEDTANIFRENKNELEKNIEKNTGVYNGNVEVFEKGEYGGKDGKKRNFRPKFTIKDEKMDAEGESDEISQGKELNVYA